MTVALPPGVQSYKRTPIFTEMTLPAGLLNDHRTKAGVWGLIHVLEGRLIYRVTDPDHPASETVLAADTPPGIIEPEILHCVQPLGAVQFQVEFFR